MGQCKDRITGIFRQGTFRQKDSSPLPGEGDVRKLDGQLVPLGYGRCRPCTYGLSTW